MPDRQRAGVHAVSGIDCYHIKPGLLGGFMGLKIGFRRQPQLFLLLTGHHLLRKTVRSRRPQLDLYKNQEFRIFSNQVDFAIPTVKIPFHNGIPLLN